MKTLGVKHLPDGSVLRLQLSDKQIRRVQERILPGWWRNIPEPFAAREAMVWNWHERPAVDAEGRTRMVSVFMVLPPDVALLPLTDSYAERWIASCFTTVKDNQWWDEEYGTWRDMSTFFTLKRK